MEAPANFLCILEQIITCTNQCGSYSVTDNGNCGFGLLIANDAARASCFSKAVNVVPNGQDVTVTSSSGSFEGPRCLVDSSSSRILANGPNTQTGTNGMTVARCAALATDDTWKYFGLENGS